MSDNIISLADRRAARGQSPHLATHVERVAEGGADDWQAIFAETAAGGQYACALVLDASEMVGGLAVLLTGAKAAGWEATRIEAYPHGGIVLGMAVTAKLPNGGAS